MLDMRDATARDAFLAVFPIARRAYVTNCFLFACRRGASMPAAVVAAVEHDLLQAAARACRWHERAARDRAVYDVIRAQHEAALAFAGWALAWERLTPADKARLRAGQREQYQHAWMDQQLATAKQLAYVRALGYTGDVTSKAHASELIERLKRERRAA